MKKTCPICLAVITDQFCNNSHLPMKHEATKLTVSVYFQVLRKKIRFLNKLRSTGFITDQVIEPR